MIGLYFHIPFCLKKCPYCSFYSIAHDDETVQKYVDALVKNVRFYDGMGISADTIYFGGGTPSLLSPKQIESVINACTKTFEIPDPEITLEANPCTVDLQKLRELQNAGVNRLSFGIQSADDEQLEFLGRLHNFEQAREAVLNAEKAGFDNISGDLMLGLKGQDIHSLKATLNKMTKLPLTHISAYMLKIEEGTAFYSEEVFRCTADEELMRSLYIEAVKCLEEYGFEQYEISNFARNKAYSRHNLKYWHGEEYLGFGAGAHSFFKGSRFFCSDSVSEYINSDVQDRNITEEKVDRAEEYVLLGLRLNEGIDCGMIKKYYGSDSFNRFKAKADLLKNAGLLRFNNERISLTVEGMLVSNSVIFELLDTLT